MKGLYFPVPWTYDIVIGGNNANVTLTAANQYKIMTGASVKIESGATVNLSGSAIAYSAFNNQNLTYGGGGKGYPVKPAAIVVVNGTLNVTGSFGGLIKTTQTGAKIIANGTMSVSSNEIDKVNQAGALKVFKADLMTITETSKFEDGTALEKGKTYTYNGTAWA